MITLDAEEDLDRFHFDVTFAYAVGLLAAGRFSNRGETDIIGGGKQRV